MCMIPHQGIGSPLSSLLISLFGGAQGRGWRGSMLVLHILQRQKPDPMEKTSHTIKSRCACVWNFSGWNSHPFLHDSIFYFEIWANFLFLFSFPFFFFCFWVRIYFFSCIAHTFLHDEESCQSDGVSFCMWMEDMFLRNFQCRSQHEYMRSLCDLDLKSMKWIS